MREKEIKLKLVQTNKNDELIQFIQAVKEENWSKSIEIIHNNAGDENEKISQLN